MKRLTVIVLAVLLAVVAGSVISRSRAGARVVVAGAVLETSSPVSLAGVPIEMAAWPGADSQVAAPAAPELPKDGFVDVIVVDERDRPASEAVVTIDSEPSMQLVTGPDGGVTFKDLPRRAFVVLAQKGDAASQPVRVQAGDGRLTARVVLRPRPAVVVEVRAMSDDTPVPRATVRMDGAVSASATTESSGRVTLTGLPEGTYTLRVAAEKYGSVWRTVTLSPGSFHGHEVVRLDSGVSVSGVVRDRSGRPVAGARITREDVGTIEPLATRSTDPLVSDARGDWTFEGVAGGLYRFRAEEGRLGTSTSTPVSVDGRTPVRDVEIELGGGGKIRGAVLTATGQGIAGATVRATPLLGGFARSEPRTCTSDADGHFELAGLPPGRVEVMATLGSGVSPKTPVDVIGNDSVATVAVALMVGGEIRGSVVTSAGAPAPGARVTAYEYDARGRGAAAHPDAEAVADETGAFVLTALPASGYLVFPTGADQSRDFGLGALTKGTQARTGSSVRLVLRGGGGLAGRVAFTDGTVPRSFDVAVDGIVSASNAGPDGSFRIDGVPVGARSVRVLGPDFATKALPDVSVGPGLTDLGAIVVDPGTRASGRVLDAEGRGVAGATVIAAKNLIGDSEAIAGRPTFVQSDCRTTVSGKDGAFVLTGLTTEHRVVAAEHPKLGRSQPLSLDVESELTLQLAEGGVIEGRVTVGGRPAEGVLVAVTSTKMASELPSQSFGNVTGPDGAYRVTNVPSGEYNVIATRSSGAAQSGGKMIRASVSAGADTTADFAFGAEGVTVNLTLASPPRDGQPLQVVLSGRTPLATTIGAAGTAQLNDVEPGEYAVCVVSAAFGRPNAPKDATPRCERVMVEAAPAVQTVTLP